MNKDRKAFTRLVNPLRSGLDSLLRPWRCQARNPRIPSCHSSGFTRLVNPLRSGLDSLLRPWRCQARNPRIPSCHSSGFTLAETLIALTVLGIVAALTVPSVVRRQIEASNRTKIKKIMGVYDGFVQKAVIENDIKSEDGFRKWADSANAENHDCENSSGYFKITKYVRESDGVNNKCEFTLSDGVVLNITNPLNPEIAPSEKDYLKYKADNNYAKAYKFVVSFDKTTGAFRVNDLAYEKINIEEEYTKEKEENIEDLEKLMGFIDPNFEKESEPAPRWCSGDTKKNGKYVSCLNQEQSHWGNEEWQYNTIYNYYDKYGNTTAIGITGDLNFGYCAAGDEKSVEACSKLGFKFHCESIFYATSKEACPGYQEQEELPD